jgi:uncharacterized protein
MILCSHSRNKLAVTSSVVVLMFSLVLLSGCTHTEKQYYPNGNLMQLSEYKGKKLHGLTKIFYETGALMQEITYSNGIISGKVLSWYSRGVKRSEEIYYQGKKNGRCSYWDDMGNLIEQKEFVNDILEGNYRMWYEDGTLKIDGKYKNGQFDSIWSYYSINGLKIGEGHFLEGKGSLKGFDQLGKKIQETEYSNSKKNGREITYDGVGNVVNILEYVNDKVVVK